MGKMKDKIKRMDGKICMVTGGSSGIGRSIALELAELGAEVVIVCRDRERGEATRKEIETRVGKNSVHLSIADLSSQKSIRKLSLDFHEKHTKLHVLVNNAAVIMGERSLTTDQIETTFAVNHLAYFLFTNLLLDLLKLSAPARIVNVASSAHFKSSLDFNNLQGTKTYSAFGAYCMSKLANVLFTYELASRLKGKGVTVNCLHPGTVATNLERDAPLTFKLPWKILKPFFLSPEKGADTAVYLASSNEVDDVSGKYFVKRRETKSSKKSYDENTMYQLWQVSADLTQSAL